MIVVTRRRPRERCGCGVGEQRKAATRQAHCDNGIGGGEGGVDRSHPVLGPRGEGGRGCRVGHAIPPNTTTCASSQGQQLTKRSCPPPSLLVVLSPPSKLTARLVLFCCAYKRPLTTRTRAHERETDDVRRGPCVRIYIHDKKLTVERKGRRDWVWGC
jgi:hypothetical protein